jgi:hypothetical protein
MKFLMIVLLLFIPFSLAHGVTFELESPGLTEDDFFYFLDGFFEKLNVYSTFEDSRKAVQELKFASEKLSEAKRVSSIENFEKSILSYENYILSSGDRIVNSEVEVLDFADLLHELVYLEYEILTLREALILESEISAPMREEYRGRLTSSFSEFADLLVLKTPDVGVVNELSPEDVQELSHRMESIRLIEMARAEMKLVKTRLNIELVRDRLISKNFSDLEVDVVVDISDNIEFVSLDPIPELPVSAINFNFDNYENYFKKAVLELRSAESYFKKEDYKNAFYSASFASEIINSIVTFI